MGKPYTIVLFHATLFSYALLPMKNVSIHRNMITLINCTHVLLLVILR